MAKIKQKKEELLNHLLEQYDFLTSSCRIFDEEGKLYEAKRIAQVLRVLLHNTSFSHSLVDQLGIKNKVEYLDTSGRVNKGNFLTSSNLVFTRVSQNGAEYFPFLNDTPYPPCNKKFDSWWNGIVIEDNKNSLFSRKRLVLAMANTDGASHVAPELDTDYHNLTRMNGMNTYFSIGDKESFAILNVELNTMRQIGYEMIISLENYFEKENIIYK